MAGEQDLPTLLRALAPELHADEFAFVCVPLDTDPRGLDAIATVHESEGLTLVLPATRAASLGLRPLFRAACITLRVHSDLAAVGLTAAVAQALAAHGIACNVIAGAHHDHLFVPPERADDALRCLQDLSANRTRPCR